MGLELLLPVMIIALLALMYLQNSRQRRSMAELRTMQDSLVPGDRVLTTSGLQATIVGTDEETVDLEIAPGVRTTWDRRVIREKIDTTPGTAGPDAPGTGGDPRPTGTGQ